MRTRLFGGASSFAHLAGIGRASRRAEDEDRDDKETKRSRRAEDDDEDDEPKGRKSRAADDDDMDGKGSKRSRRAEDDDEDDDEPKGRKSRASDDDDQDDEPKARKARRARAEEDDEDDEPKGRKSRAADDDDDQDDEPKGRKSRASDDDDDDDDKHEMTGRSVVANARRRERERCAAIFGSRHAAGNIALAASLAFDTTMTRREAIAVLKGQAARGDQDRDDRRLDRASRNPDLGPGGASGPAGQAAMAASWDRALAKAGVPARK